MTINLTNPITENLTIEQLAGQNDNCFGKRTGYEVIADNEVFALIPQAEEDETAQIGEIVTVGSFGLPRRAQVVRVLSGFEDDYTDQRIIEENEVIYKVQEYTYSQMEGKKEYSYEIKKEILN
ncbi:hypothetical protein [Desulfosporosinus sp. FKA]|uniref:hypothetical protein n=1 Tax=Desulfosporosinus sp. FKA TaxID=1969834 RepID=UPI000B49D243|nr:hypothetical protein [Desulfosporosinus sp. FKA]